MGRSGRLVVFLLAFALMLAPVPAGALVRGDLDAKPRVAATASGSVSAEAVGAAVAEVEPNDNIPGQLLFNGNTGTLDDGTDIDDVFAVHLVAGDVLEVRLTHGFSGGGWGDVDLYLYGPGTSDVGIDPVLDWSLEYRVNREYIRFVCPASAVGTYYVDVYSGDTDGETISYELRAAVNGFSPDFSGIERYAGPTRYDTSAEISYQTFPEGGCDSAVIASGKGFADALAGAGLAGAVDGPLLLTHPDYVPWSVWDELDRLGVTDVYIIGGTGAVSDMVYDELDTGGLNVERIAGTTRYDTAAAVANRMNDADMYNGAIDEAFVVCGSNYPDALAASPWSYANGIPILLTPTTVLAVPTQAFLSANCDRGIVVGGSAAVSDGVLADVANSVTTAVHRIAGTNRYQTAASLAETLDGWGTYANDFHFVGFASGSNFPDALAGGAALGYEGGVLLLTPTAAMNAETLASIQNEMTWGDDAAVFGGEGAVSFNAMEDAYYELENKEP